MTPLPTIRRLRVFAFDPSFSDRIDMERVNEVTVAVPWEAALSPGPVGEYVEVVDHDPSSGDPTTGTFWSPVDLNDRTLLAQDGVTPSETNPQFHQQMVYAVAMATIGQFERALGRVAFWAEHRERDSAGEYLTQFVRRLRIYPHALRERNAYYSPRKKALLFGYFPIEEATEGQAPGTIVYTCLSHDIIAHEVTHALLDGVHPRFNESTNPDVHAFHEAFADIVALFQHFSYPKVIESQIRTTRGSLDSENLLCKLAWQFGRATGRGGALRDALGRDVDGQWQPREPDPTALETTRSPHARGAILVAAVFRAFLLIYRHRTADLFRLATQGTGVLPEGEIHPDLTHRLSREAAKCAERVLQMCIRAIDYCPPVDIRFGDYLRAIVTADTDYAPEDTDGYRLVFVQSFREWGIHPRDVCSVGLDALLWPSGDEVAASAGLSADPANPSAAESGANPKDPSSCSPTADMRRQFRDNFVAATAHWSQVQDRWELWKLLEQAGKRLHEWLHDGDSYGRHYAHIFGLVVDGNASPSIYRSSRTQRPAVEIHSVRPAVRRTVRGGTRTDLVVEITQRRRGYYDPAQQQEVDQGVVASDALPAPDFLYRAGCTLLIDPATQDVRRVIRTAGTIADDAQLERVRRFLTGEEGDVGGNAMDAGLTEGRGEPFALLHRD